MLPFSRPRATRFTRPNFAARMFPFSRVRKNRSIARTRPRTGSMAAMAWVIMAGAPCCEGNVTPAAEYNIWCDPEAARVVLHSGLPIELVGWHLCRGDAALNPEDIKYVLSFGTPQARFAIECNSRAQQAYLEQTGEHGISLPDPVAMSIALDPSIVTKQSEHFVDVETSSELTLGMTVVDRLNVAGNDRNRAVWMPVLNRGIKAKVYWTIDNSRWKQAFYSGLR